MRSNSGNRISKWHILSLWIIVWSFSACYEPEEGCLDVKATNFTASADDPCADCCTFPSLIFSISHNFEDTIFRYGEAFTFDSLQFFRVAKVKFYLSDVELSRGGERFEVEDSLSLAIIADGQSQRVIARDDVVLMSRDIATFDYTIGTVDLEGSYDSIYFSIGLADPLNQAQPDSLPTDHPLAPQTDSMYWDEDRGYIFNKVWFQRDSITGLDTTRLEIGGAANLVRIGLPFTQVITLGVNVEVPLQIDYAAWFKGIDFVADTDDVILNKLVENTTDVFSIAE